MPYTAPSVPSPPAHHPEPSSPKAPEASRPEEPRARASNSTSSRPPLPRSFSSTSYLRRHRRSPSFSRSPEHPLSPVAHGDAHTGHVLARNPNIQQSPSPVSGAMIPSGAIISPPESAQNSSDDDDDKGADRRGDQHMLVELQEAIRSIEQHRSGSPVHEGTAEPVELATSLKSHGKHAGARRPPLSKAARKISHSRSSTESSILGQQSESPFRSTDESDQDEACMSKKPPMLRKKSGELVRPALRPASACRRPSSMPGTPTFSKAVHFDSHLEHIRHFLQLDKPLAVSAGSSPVEYNTAEEYPFNEEPKRVEFDIRVVNFPSDSSERRQSVVRLERVFLSSDHKNLVGVVAVANLAFNKLVVARFTLDYWKTTSEVVAEFSDDVRRKYAHDGYDRFNFNIGLTDLANLESKTMFICIRYQVDGKEFWDNNNSMNYQVDFTKSVKPRNDQFSTPLGARPRQALPRSRAPLASGLAPRPYSMPSFDDFSTGFDGSDPFNGNGNGNGNVIKNQAQEPSLRTKVSSDDIVNDPPIRRSKPAPQAFGHRYDFGASLSAAMQPGSIPPELRQPPSRRRSETGGPQATRESVAAQVDKTKPEKRTGLPLQRSKAAVVAAACNGVSSKPADLISGKPHHQSPVYKELVDRYCFFGSQKSANPVNKETQNEKSEHVPTAEHHSIVHRSSPSHNREMTSEKISSPHNISPRVSRSVSPAPAAGSSMDSHTSTPVAFGYPYHQNMQHGFFSESHAPTAIQG